MKICTIWMMFLGLSATAFAADSDFNGRWDITANTKPRPRAFWLEITGAGTPQMAGRFVSAYAGDMNRIDEISIEKGELRFAFHPPQRANQAAPGKPVWRARLVAGKLEGTFVTEGRDAPATAFTGMRAPEIADKDDGSWKEGPAIQLFNGKDLSGWKGLNPGQEVKWSVVNGVLKNAPPTTDIVSERSFWNFTAHIEFRIVEHSNSGIGLRGRYEIQVLDDYGRPPNTHGAAALYSRIAPSVNASKPAGEWQTYDIRLVGLTLTVTHNGTKVLDHVQIEGLTAIATNADEAKPGPFIVQGDHSNVEIRKFEVRELRAN